MIQNENDYAICCRLEVDDDVISGIDVDTFRCCAFVILWVDIFNSSRGNLYQHLYIYIYLYLLWKIVPEAQKQHNLIRSLTRQLTADE